MPFYGVYIPVKSGSGGAPVNGGGNGATGAGGAGGAGVIGAAAMASVGGCGDQNPAEMCYVFQTKNAALDMLKVHKDARMREFSSEDDATKYAHTGYEVVQTKYSDVRTSTASLEKALFRAPTKQELVEFRKQIEADNYERVKMIIWDNPRYLVSSGDTPTALKEGYRYNALHICAISKKPRIAELILQTVSDPKFADLLMGKKNDENMSKELANNLLDYYLNIPEKGRSETPLHFAAKNGCIEMVEVLTSYPECKMKPNSEGALPKDIICSRATQAPPELRLKIAALLDERFYVPVLRSMDSAIPPQIGQPFSSNDPPNLNCDPLSPEVKIQALAGPMNKEQAKQFCRRWKTPPRLGSSASSPIGNIPFISPRKPPCSGNGSTVTSSTTPRDGNKNSSSSHADFTTAITPSMQRRLFDASPAKSSDSRSDEMPLATHTAAAEDEEAHETDDGIVATATIAATVDKQNGNQMSNSLAKQPEILLNDMHKVECANETNNNNHQQQQQQQLKLQPPQQKVKSTFDKLRSALCPSTPLLKAKKDLFFTYREPHADADTPIKYEAFNVADENDPNDSNIIFAGGSGSAIYDTPGFKERHIKLTDPEKGLEVIGRELAKEQKVEWREYWDFFDAFIDIASTEGLQKLEQHLSQRAAALEVPPPPKRTSHAQNAVVMDDVCNALEKFCFLKNASSGGGVSGVSGGVAGQNWRNGFSYERTHFSGNAASSVSVAQPDVAPQATTPYTCVEKSLQVFAKRMTKTIIHNIENVVSINDTLLSELKRLKSLICSFKEDVRFLNVNFAKVHSRIGNLVSIYLANSVDVTYPMKAKIHGILQNLLLTPGERREHMECVCARIAFMLEHSPEQILPENLKTEEMCAKIWLQERDCDCQWDSNLSRKASRRNRMEARYKNFKKQAKQDKTKKEVEVRGTNADTQDEWHDMSGNESSSDLDDDVFWSDFGGSASGTDEEDLWQTPPESPSRLSLISQTEDDCNKVFIYGNEPTKRDLDVLNAIFHANVDKTKYPHIHSWKATLLRYTNEEMDYFPAPAIVSKSHSFNNLQSPAKKDFTCTSRQQHNPSLTVTHTTPDAAAAAKSTPIIVMPQSKKQQTYAERRFMGISANSACHKTPLGKMRGLFSAYRERCDNSSPMSSPGSFCSERERTPARNNVDSSKNISLLNVSSD